MDQQNDAEEIGRQVADYMATVRAAAERYIELGWSIIPILPDAKVPAIPWTELQTRQPTDQEVASWFEDGVPDGKGGQTKFFGIGCVTGAISKLVVLDCDTADALAYALGEGGLWSPLGTTTTRGQHLYFKHPGERIQNKAGGIGLDWPNVPGLDLRGDGGYVVVPPTIKFDGEGKFKHRYSFTVPDPELLDAVFSLPTWPGLRGHSTSIAPPPLDADGEFSLADLRLDGVRSYGASVWEDAAKRITKLGRKMRDGDGRNAWLTRYIGECISTGMVREDAETAAGQFSAAYFDPALPPQEVATILGSVLSTDKRNHPEKYAPPPPAAPAKNKRNGIRLITSASLGELRKRATGRRFLIDPYIPPQSITQVVGFNGHGKSLFLLNLMWAASLGQDFGPASIDQTTRVLYLDHESSEPTLAERIAECEAMLGPMPDSMTIWGKSVSDLGLDFTQQDGIARLDALLDEVKPEVVVIDTVREAWAGMEENSPHAWLKVNQLALACRNAGLAVVLVHHRNKPNQQGIGREAGSTAQLKDLDTQIFITKIIEDEDQARREAALHDSATIVVASNGAVASAFTYLRALLDDGESLRAVFEVTFGKVRSGTENHAPAYIGFAANIKTGRRRVVSTFSPRQKAVRMLRAGRSIENIAESLVVPMPVVERWISNTKGDQA